MLELSEELKKRHARDFGTESCKVLEWNEDGIERLILNIRGSHFTQYLGIPTDHPLAGYGYDEIPVRCHGGLTFSEEGKGGHYPAGFYWYGWDYAHAGDCIYFGIDKESVISEYGIDWTLEEVIEDGWSAYYDFKLLKELVEKIVKKIRR